MDNIRSAGDEIITPASRLLQPQYEQPQQQAPASPVTYAQIIRPNQNSEDALDFRLQAPGPYARHNPFDDNSSVTSSEISRSPLPQTSRNYVNLSPVYGRLNSNNISNNNNNNSNNKRPTSPETSF